MRVSNEPDEGGGIGGAFGELLRLQTDFQARLADETLRYLRRLQGAMGPAAPGTIVIPVDGAVVRAAGRPGGSVALRLEVENLQRVHSMTTPQLTPLVGRAGTTWFPELVSGGPSSLLVPPDSVHLLEIEIRIPEGLPDDVYAGALLLQGFRDGAVAVVVEVGEPAPAKPAGRTRSRRTTAPAAEAGSTETRRGGGATGAAKNTGARKSRSGGTPAESAPEPASGSGRRPRPPRRPAEGGP